MKSIILTALLLVTLSIVSSAQIGDSLVCYNREELRRIADRVVRAKECDTLLSLCYQNVMLADSMIYALNRIVDAKDKQITAYDSIIIGKNADIAFLQDQAFHDGKKIKWLKIGWISTSVLLGGIITILL